MHRDSNTHEREAFRLMQQLRHRELTPAEWSRLSALAETDPFLADAIEGLRTVSPEIRQAHLQSVQTRLAGRTHRPRRRVLWWSASAAAVLALLVVAAIWLFPTAPDEQSAVLVEQVPPAADTPEPDESEAIVAETELPEAESETRDDATVGSTRSTPAKQESPTKSRADKTPPPAAPKPETQSTQPSVLAEAAPVVKEEMAGRSPAKARDADGAGTDQLFAVAEPQISGQILDPGGQPLPGARIALKGTPELAESDPKGNFALSVPSAPVANGLVISYAGYGTVETAAVPGDSIVVQMTDAKSDEALIQNFQSARTQLNARSARALSRPSLGERSYQKYIRQNLEYPPQAADENIHGTVVLEFDIDPTGKPYNFRILQSVGYGCDEEAIRLIREGPLWDLSSAQVPVGRWQITF